MIFLGDLEKINDSKAKPKLIHYMPFDKINGLNKTDEQLRLEGMLVEYIPKPEKIEGKVGEMFINPKTSEIFYEYKDIPKVPITKDETELQRIEALEKSNAEMMALISSLATPTV